MSKSKVTFRWEPGWKPKGKKPPVKVQEAIRQSLQAAAFFLSTRLKETLSQKKSFVINGKWAGTPARPLEAPAKFTGDLSRSVVTDDSDLPKNKMRVGTNKGYGRDHEYGIPGKLPMRPWMRPTIAKSNKKLADIMAEAMRKTIGGRRK